MTTEYSARVTRDGSDFQAELVVWEDGREADAYLVGWFDTHARALAAANEELTDVLAQAARLTTRAALEAAAQAAAEAERAEAALWGELATVTVRRAA